MSAVWFAIGDRVASYTPLTHLKLVPFALFAVPRQQNVPVPFSADRSGSPSARLAAPARQRGRLGRRPARPDRKFPSACVRRADLIIRTAKKVLRSRTPEFRIKISGRSSRHANGNEGRGTTPHSRAPALGRRQSVEHPHERARHARRSHPPTDRRGVRDGVGNGRPDRRHGALKRFTPRRALRAAGATRRGLAKSPH